MSRSPTWEWLCALLEGRGSIASLAIWRRSEPTRISTARVRSRVRRAGPARPPSARRCSRRTRRRRTTAGRAGRAGRSQRWSRRRRGVGRAPPSPSSTGSGVGRVPAAQSCSVAPGASPPVAVIVTGWPSGVSGWVAGKALVRSVGCRTRQMAGRRAPAECGSHGHGHGSAVVGGVERVCSHDGHFSIQSILDRLVEHIVDTIPVTAAAVTLISKGSSPPHYISASNSAAMRFEKLQSELSEGPGLAAFPSDGPVSVPDLATDARFTRFSPHAVEAGLVAVFAFPLRHGDHDALGALDQDHDTLGRWTTTPCTLRRPWPMSPPRTS